MTELEKIDVIRERLGVSYYQAREALNRANGDLVEAIIILEEKNQDWTAKLNKIGYRFSGEVRGIIEKSKNTKIKVKKEDKTLFEIPAPVGALGVLGVLASPQLAVIGALGTIAAMANKYTLDIEQNKDDKDDIEQKQH